MISGEIKLILGLIAGILLFPSFAKAEAKKVGDWFVSIEQDPISDKNKGTAAIGDADGNILLITCNQDSDLTITLGVNLNYDAAPDELKQDGATFDMSMRTDKNSVRTMRVEADRTKSGKTAFGNADNSIDAFGFLKDILAAKNRVVVAVGSDTHVFSARGAPQVAKTLVEACSIRLPDGL